ncbi:MAG TPA: alpha/beta hydrolase [Desulfobacteraceae bacterium]|nr:alpha/beta hydrolase [Desulfobacteraceae bacterium]
MMSKDKSNIYIDDGGNGSLPLIFVHSMPGTSQHWSAQLSHIRTTRRGIAFDLRGNGRSSSPENGDYAIASMVQDVQMVADQLNIERFILVGHSMGGSVAGAYAGGYPERVAGLLLVDPSGNSTQMPIEERQEYLGALESEACLNVIEAYLRHILTGSTETTRAKVLRDLRDTPKATVVGAFKELLKYNPVPALERYDGPTLSVITSITETPFSVHKLVPNLPYKMITGTGHWLQLDKPEEFNRIMDDFLSSVEIQK